MIIDRVALRGFRSYTDSAFSFKDGVNIIWGENARGKTNLLEGIMLLSGAASWRTRKRGDLIHFQREAAAVEGSVEARGRSFDIAIRMPLRGKTAYTVNGVAQKRQYDLSEYLRCVLFCPDDLYLVKGGPDKRRRFMDTALGQLRPRYAAILAEYQKLCEMKQFILKDGGSMTVLPEINDRMVYYGAEIVHYRGAFLFELSRRPRSSTATSPRDMKNWSCGIKPCRRWTTPACRRSGCATVSKPIWTATGRPRCRAGRCFPVPTGTISRSVSTASRPVPSPPRGRRGRRHFP